MPDPFVVLGDDGADAPRLRYNIPEATGYAGQSVISVDVDVSDLNRDTRERLHENRRAKFERPGSVRPRGSIGDLRISVASTTLPIDAQPQRTFYIANTQERAQSRSEAPLTMTIKRPLPTLTGFDTAYELVVPTSPPEDVISPKILFYETLKISSFLGNYGAGRVIKTFSLFPGEQTKISVKNYKKTKIKSSQTINEGSSILDSVTEEASDDFENSVQNEQSNKYNESEADILNSQSRSTHKEGSGGASALWGMVDVSGSGASTNASQTTGEWGTRSAREEVAKNVSSALEKHSTRSSAKRNVEVNSSLEQEASFEEETVEKETIKRTIENINKSRTLNLVFRQMVQEFVSVVHLTDIRIALYDETDGPYATYSIRELDRFLQDNFSEDAGVQSAIRRNILREFYYVFDYQDQPQPFLEVARLDFPDDDIGLDVDFPTDATYVRVRKDLRSRIEGSEFLEVDGVALAVNRTTMRTEGVIVDAILGEGDALDDYAQAVQAETVNELATTNRALILANARQELENQIIEDQNEASAEIYRTLFPCCPTHTPDAELATPEPEE
jgi:hypothetical protein